MCLYFFPVQTLESKYKTVPICKKKILTVFFTRLRPLGSQLYTQWTQTINLWVDAHSTVWDSIIMKGHLATNITSSWKKSYLYNSFTIQFRVGIRSTRLIDWQYDTMAKQKTKDHYNMQRFRKKNYITDQKFWFPF